MKTPDGDFLNRRKTFIVCEQQNLPAPRAEAATCNV